MSDPLEVDHLKNVSGLSMGIIVIIITMDSFDRPTTTTRYFRAASIIHLFIKILNKQERKSMESRQKPIQVCFRSGMLDRVLFLTKNLISDDDPEFVPHDRRLRRSVFEFLLFGLRTSLNAFDAAARVFYSRVSLRLIDGERRYFENPAAAAAAAHGRHYSFKTCSFQCQCVTTTKRTNSFEAASAADCCCIDNGESNLKGD